MDLTALHDDIDRSFGNGPDLPPQHTGRLLQEGRRARRRRRTWVAASSMTLALLIGVPATAVTRASIPDRSSGVASEGTSRPAMVPGDLDLEVDTSMDSGGIPVGYDGTGELVRSSSDVVVTGHFDDVLDNIYDRTAALEVTAGGTTTWMVLMWDPTAGQGFSAPAPDDETFAHWVGRLVRDRTVLLDFTR